MSSDSHIHAEDTERPAGYEPPRLLLIGTLADLTQGGTEDPDDAYGGAGASGTIP